MLHRFTIDREGSQDGFTLIELLIVMILIGVLAGIAIPTFLAQRQNGWRAAMKSDLRNAAIGAQGWSVVTGNGSFSGLTNSVLDNEREGIATADVTVVVMAAGASGFCLAATNTNLPGETLYYDSLRGVPAPSDCSAIPY